jgi:membrane-bound lytic murein transglycosylase MltF
MRLAAVLAAILPMCAPVDEAKPVERCSQHEHLLHRYNPGWDVARMSRIMWRESRCQPQVRSRTSDTGVLQINDINRPWLTQRLGFEVTVEALKDADINVRSSAELYKFWRRAVGDGYQPWKKTSGGS